MLVPRTLRSSLLLAGAGALLSVPGAAQIFVKAGPAQMPQTGSYTEDVDFGDIDGDGDWDAFLGDGGDGGNDQDRVYVNMGGPPGFGGGGTIGFYEDKTALLLPVVSDDTRDIDFGDIDGDGDLDSHNSNTAQLSNQCNRWWINLGGKQGGTQGFYADETATHWVGIGGPGSSVAPSQVLGSGGFIDWSCDSDFADVDADGDIDLHHSSYGGSFVGNVPHRVFLNDGEGYFSEFNPSGFQLSGAAIAPGNPGLWCEGTYTPETYDTSGAQCDIAASPVGIDVADVDGDLDLDLLMGNRTSQPRLFKSTFAESGGSTPIFRDVTGQSGTPGAAFSSSSTGSDNYEQELGDMDRDGDVDAYLANYVGLTDNLFDNPGNGQFEAMQSLSSSGNDDNNGDFIDYDVDGNLDLVTAAFAGTNRLYRNDYAGAGPGTFSYSFISSAISGFVSSRSLDTQVADVDADGDYDDMTAEDSGNHEILYLNTLTSNDAIAPYFGRRDAVGDQVAAAGSLAIRTQAYDNTPHYTNWHNDVRVELAVDGCRLPDLVAVSSMGQIFRALLPKNLVGAVSFAWRSTDEHGNNALSTTTTYTGSSGLAFESHFGTATPGAGGTPAIDALSVPFAGTTLHLAVTGLPAGTQYLIGITDQNLAAPLVLPGLVTVNVAGNVLFLGGGLADAAGCGVKSLALPGGVPAGIVIYAQGVAFNGTGGNLLSGTDGLEITTQ